MSGWYWPALRPQEPKSIGNTTTPALGSACRIRTDHGNPSHHDAGQANSAGLFTERLICQLTSCTPASRALPLVTRRPGIRIADEHEDPSVVADGYLQLGVSRTGPTTTWSSRLTANTPPSCSAKESWIRLPRTDNRSNS
jgi:hypothetical protein